MKIICIGRNYAKHIEELQNEKPSHPVVFLKPDSSIPPKNHPFIIPAFSEEIHYEVEVLVKICKVGKHIQQQFAHTYYQEIGLGIDFTARDLQTKLRQKGLPWEISKGFDGSAFIGKFLKKENLGDLSSLPFSLYKNQEIVQQGNTAKMLWGIDELVSYVSQFFTLKTGDILFTGTPAGVGKVATGDLLTGTLNGVENFQLKVR